MIAALAWPFVALVGIAVVAVFAWRLLPASLGANLLDGLADRINLGALQTADLEKQVRDISARFDTVDKTNDQALATLDALLARVSKLEMSKAFGRTG